MSTNFDENFYADLEREEQPEENFIRNHLMLQRMALEGTLGKDWYNKKKVLQVGKSTGEIPYQYVRLWITTSSHPPNTNGSRRRRARVCWWNETLATSQLNGRKNDAMQITISTPNHQVKTIEGESETLKKLDWERIMRDLINREYIYENEGKKTT